LRHERTEPQKDLESRGGTEPDGLTEREKDPLQKYLRYSHLGMQFFLSVALFTAGGLWLDSKLGTLVLFTLLGLAIGFGGGTYCLYSELFGPRRGVKGKASDSPDTVEGRSKERPSEK
jgi:hypothetical protein